MKDYIVNIQQCIFIYVHSKLYWMSVGRLPKVPSLSTLFLSPFFSLFCVFVEGAKLCSIWAGWSTRGERTFPQAPGRAEQGVQEKCPWGESSTLAHPPPILSTCRFPHLHFSRYWLSASLPPHTATYRELFISFVKSALVHINVHLWEVRLTPPPPPSLPVAQLIFKCWGLAVMLASGWVRWEARGLIYQR